MLRVYDFSRLLFSRARGQAPPRRQNLVIEGMDADDNGHEIVLNTGRISVREYGATGDGTTDDTAAVQEALNAAAGRTAVFPRPAVAYRVGTLRPPVNSTLVFEPGCVLESDAALLGGGASVTTIPMFHLTGVGDFRMSGYGATLRMVKAGFSSEFNHVIYIQAHTGNVLIEGLSCNSSGGDGILCKSDNSNCVLRDVVCHDNRRNGLAIGRCKSFEAYGCTFSGSTHIVRAGVDIEPDNPTDTLGPIRFYGCKAKDNNGSGYFIYLNAWRLATNIADIEFHGCHSENNGLDTTGTGAGFDVSRVADTPVGLEGPFTPCTGHIRFVGCTSKNDGYGGFTVYNKSLSGPRVSIIRPTIIDANQRNSTDEWRQNAINSYNDGAYAALSGGIDVIEPKVIQTVGGGGNMARAFFCSDAGGAGTGHDDVNVTDWTLVGTFGSANPISHGAESKGVRLARRAPRYVDFTTSQSLTDGRYRHGHTVLTNRGASGTIAYTLPDALAGRVGWDYEFAVVAAQELRIAPQAGDTIYPLGSGAGDLITSNTPGSTCVVRVVALNEWRIVALTGTWS